MNAKKTGEKSRDESEEGVKEVQGEGDRGKVNRLVV